MRFVGSFIKYVMYLCIVLIALTAALFWFDTGSWLVRPIAERAGNYFLAPMTLSIDSIDGSVREGFALGGLSLSSGDENLFTIDYASVSPDWDLVLSGMDGIPYVKSLYIKGVSSDLDRVMMIASHFTAVEEEAEEKEASENDNNAPSTFHINPFMLSISDVHFGSPYAALSLDAITLNPDGTFVINAEITSRDNTLPIKADAQINFEPIEIVSSELFIGQKGTGKLTGSLEPMKAFLSLTALSLDEFMKFAPDLGVKASGRIDARVSAVSDDGKLKASGVLSMPRANVMDVPLNFRLPFEWDGVSLFTLDNATLNTNAASLKLNAATDITSMHVKADGEAQNISLNEIGRMFAPDIGLEGEGGYIKFNVDAPLTGEVMDILTKTDADINANIPQITAAGAQILRGLGGKVKLTPGSVPRLSVQGEVFKGKLFARGEAQHDQDGTIKPSAIVSVVNLDIPTVIRTFPELAKSVKSPAGKVTARAVISDTLNVDARVNSDKLSANGVTLSNILAEMTYNHERGLAELDNLSLNLGKGRVSASGSANLKSERFSFRADAENIEPRIIPDLRDVKGMYNLTAQGNGRYTNINSIKAEGRLTAKNVGYSDIAIGSLNVPFDFANNVARITNAAVSLPKGNVKLNANANINTSRFDLTANAQNIEPRYIKALKDLAGTYNLNASASGNYTNLNTIRANADLKARNVGYAGITVGNLDVPVSFANNILNVANARAALPGGSVNLNGTVNVKNAANPGLDLSLSTKGINLAEVMTKYGVQNKDMPVSGRVWGSVNVKGPATKAGVNAAIRAMNVKVGKSVDIPSGALDVVGTTQRVVVRNVEATVNDAVIKGNGYMDINQKNIMNSAVNFKAGVRQLDLEKMLNQFIGSAPASGVLRSDISVNGTIAKPSVNMNVGGPVVVSENEINDISVKVRTPQENHYRINAGARVKDFRPEADVDLWNNDGVIEYKVKTNPLDVDKAIQTQMPDMAGMAKGFLTVNVDGSTKPNSDINVTAIVPSLTLLDKVKVSDISIPVKYRTSANKVEMKKGSARLSDGDINTGFEFDANKKSWKSSLKVSHLNFGNLANKFLTNGELVGSIDVEVNAKGQLATDTNGKMMTSFANGKFATTPGYLHKMELLDKITPTKRISFQDISGTFFWNGSDVFLNPGTGARAGSDEPLYRYVSVNGSLGVLGKGLDLLFDGRFDLKILDQLLGAMKGVFQYMTGSLGRSVLKDAAGRVLGIKRRDFQNVSFRLTHSWEELRLEDLKITKAIEDFLPIDILNKDKEEQKDDTQFKLQLKFPTGPGNKSVEDESTSDQFKEQMIDNLFNFGL